tara:strand:- start:80 stop:652 length:573 start_codon:yes stop_codon:yes gene_type:complete
MIYCIDSFLDTNVFEKTKSKLDNNSYVEFETPGKSFWIQEATEDFINYVCLKLSNFEQKEIIPILGFFRVSNEDVDTEWRIHSDLNIAGHKPDRAAVLYMSPKEMSGLHGTAFWDHKKYGRSLPDNTTNEEYDRMILSEAENLDMWTLTSVVGYEQNRLISYPAPYFHSKYPNISWKNGREVFVIFYKIK